LIRRVETVQKPQESALAAAAWTNYGDGFALCESDAHVLKVPARLFRSVVDEVQPLNFHLSPVLSQTSVQLFRRHGLSIVEDGVGSAQVSGLSLNLSVLRGEVVERISYA